jgi:hypothetical protein
MTAAKKLKAKAKGPTIRLVDVDQITSARRTSDNKIIWSDSEKAKIIDAGVGIIKADPTGKLSMVQALKRAMIAALPKDRHRPLKTMTRKSYEWFRVGVEKRLSPAPEPSPRAVVTAAELAPASPPPVSLDTLFTKVESALAGLGALTVEVRRLGERLVPVEASSACVKQLVFKVIEALDPSFIAATFPPEPPPEPPAEQPPRPAPKIPKVKVCVVGLRPGAQQDVRSMVNGRATLSFSMEETKAMKKGFGHFDAVVITRHASHEIHDKALLDLDSRHVVRLQNTSASKVAEQVERFADQFEKERRVPAVTR